MSHDLGNAARLDVVLKRDGTGSFSDVVASTPPANENYDTSETIKRDFSNLWETALEALGGDFDKTVSFFRDRLPITCLV